MKKIILVIILILVVLLSGCTDKDEAGTDKSSTEQEELCSSPYIQVGTECCLDQNSNNICDSDEAVEQDVTTGSLQLDSVVQLTNYQEVIHRPPEYATISGDGSKIAFFRFVNYYDTELGEDGIHNAVYVANTNSLNEPKMVFESMTIPSILIGVTQYYYFANTGGSTALTDDGQYVYFISADSVRGAIGYTSPVHLARVNTGTNDFTAIDFAAQPGYVETRINSFVLGNDKIYYYANLVAEGEDVRDGTDLGVFKMNFDGSGKELLVKLEHGNYPRLYTSNNIFYDSSVDRVYFRGRKTSKINAFYYVEGNALKEVSMTEEQADSGFIGVSNGKIFLFASGNDLVYDVASGQVTDMGLDVVSRAVLSENGVLIYGGTVFGSYTLGAGSMDIIGSEVNEEYRDYQFGLVNTIVPFNGKSVSDNGKTILVQEAKTKFGNYYAIKLK